MKQGSFWKNKPLSHGGHLAKGKRKTARPIVTRQAMHVVLKSSRARGEWNMLRHSKVINAAIQQTAKRFRVHIHRAQNVGNHLHILAQPQHRRDFQNFLRVITQAIAFLVTKTRKGKRIGCFWDNLVFTRELIGRRDFWNMENYLEKNRLEAEGVPRDIVDFWFANPDR